MRRRGESSLTLRDFIYHEGFEIGIPLGLLILFSPFILAAVVASKIRGLLRTQLENAATWGHICITMALAVTGVVIYAAIDRLRAIIGLPPIKIGDVWTPQDGGQD